jgi:hypothetical protein
MSKKKRRNVLFITGNGQVGAFTTHARASEIFSSTKASKGARSDDTKSLKGIFVDWITHAMHPWFHLCLGTSRKTGVFIIL